MRLAIALSSLHAIASTAPYLDDPPRPEVEHEDTRYPLTLVDPVANSRRMRPPRRPLDKEPRQPVDFDPSGTTSASMCS